MNTFEQIVMCFMIAHHPKPQRTATIRMLLGGSYDSSFRQERFSKYFYETDNHYLGLTDETVRKYQHLFDEEQIV